MFYSRFTAVPISGLKGETTMTHHDENESAFARALAQAGAALAFTPHAGQAAIIADTARFRVVACGRRFGKTEVGKLLLLAHALHGGACWWLAPTYRMSGGVWRDLRRAVRGLAAAGRPAVARIDMHEREIEFADGGFIAVRSAHTPDHLRGSGLDFVVLDEAAFMPPALWNEVVRPMLLERGGGALFLSTPYGRNWFHTLYERGRLEMAEGGEWRAFHFPTAANPLIPAEALESIRAQTPEAIFRAEYLAEFLTDEGQVFRGLEAAADPALLDATPRANGQYVAGIDWGRSRDFTVIDAERCAVVAVDRFNGVGWAVQRERLAALCAHWAVSVVWAEANSIGAPNIEALQGEGLPVRAFTMTAVSKPPLIEALALERGDLRLLPYPPLVHELALFAVERLPGGGFRYSAPPGEHDDCVISLALAWYAVGAGTVGMGFA
jgi:hypothetical protein